MLDSSLKPWLVEVNGPPQLTIDSDVDLRVKHPMIRDMIRVLFETKDSDIATYCNSKTQQNKN